ncbi:MAG: PBSX family phage terminase large subunit [Firmicutes bacterium]|nr:PBSX family phage terminase large subunit [Bacillota bacterium]
MDLTIKVNKPFKPYFEDYSHRFEVYYGGAGSGKSVFIAQKLILKALRDNRKILIMRKVGSTLKDSVWQLVLDILVEWGRYSKCTINKSVFTIELENGSILLFKGMDDSEKIKSITGITDIWVEEATEFTEEDIEQLNLRLRAKTDNLQMFFSFNPVSKANWVYRRWFAKDAAITDDTVVHKSTYKDNRFLPEDYITTIEKMAKTNPTYYRIYALGEFASLDKLVFSNWKVGTVEDTSTWSLLCGLDFGYTNDPTAFVVSFMDGETLYVAKEFVRTGLLNNQIATAVTELGFAKSTIIGDSAEVKSIDELRKAGLYRIYPAAKGPGSVLQGIQKLQQLDIVVDPSCEHVITELQNYAWKKDRQSGEYVNEPIDEFNHCIDALRYSLQCVDKYKKLTTFSKLTLGL